MTTLRRAALIAGMAISVLVLVLSIAGIGVVWMVNAPVTHAAVGVLAPVERTLAEVVQATGEASQVMAEVSGVVGDVRERMDGMGQQVADLDKALQAVGTVVGERVEPLIEVLGKGARAVQEAVDSVQAAVERVNALPLIELELPAVDKLEQVRGDVERAASDLELLREAASAPQAGVLEGAFALATGPLASLDERMQTAQAKVEATRDRAAEAHATVVLLQEKLPLWLDLASLALTLLLAWLAVSQVGVFKLCRDAIVEQEHDDRLDVGPFDPG